MLPRPLGHIPGTKCPIPKISAAISVLHSGATPDSLAEVAVIGPNFSASEVAAGCENTRIATLSPPNLGSIVSIAGRIVVIPPFVKADRNSSRKWGFLQLPQPVPC